MLLPLPGCVTVECTWVYPTRLFTDMQKNPFMDWLQQQECLSVMEWHGWPRVFCVRQHWALPHPGQSLTEVWVWQVHFVLLLRAGQQRTQPCIAQDWQSKAFYPT